MRGVRLAGAVVLAVGVILLLAHTLLRNWALYDLVTPLLLAGGAEGVVWHVASYFVFLLTHSSQKTLDSLPAFAGTKGRGNDEFKDSKRHAPS